MFVHLVPNRSRVLELGSGAEQLGVALMRQRCGVEYCPSDAVPRTAPFRAAVCDLNAGHLPLSLRPPPTHIVAQGVLVYLLDRLATFRALRCAYPAAILQLSFASTSAISSVPQSEMYRHNLVDSMEAELSALPQAQTQA